ncbi:LAME_0D06480g1_1 [Lachancea meyersii CBS 8951]|uniref:LAME_0D06480g1_1 n=1 Tax=Lachancea meyersii CBS 8951 TaxID=1266667 RepID=A0A1G4J9A1_9SACH|nr:LAME_0D06480g1_1 [Lachancea meyersii CBS 8951]
MADSGSSAGALDLRSAHGSQSQIHIHHHHHYHRRAASEGNSQAKRDADEASGKKSPYQSLKSLTLNNLDAKQHFLIAVCRDVSLLPPLLSLAHSLKKAWALSYRSDVLYNNTKELLQAELPSVWHRPLAVETQASSAADLELTSQLLVARSSEYLLCSLWCVVSAYLTYAILDSLMVRWIVKYSTVAAILRMFSMSLIIVTLEMLLLSSLSPKGDYYLHTWILISCVLTGAYIWQSFLTSDLNYVQQDSPSPTPPASSSSNDLAGASTARRGSSTTINTNTRSIPGMPSSSSSSSSPPTTATTTSQVTCSPTDARKRRRGSRYLGLTKNRQIHLYNITVFCVVPVGVASFITMIGLLRNLVIQRLDLEQLEHLMAQSYSEQG